VDVDDVEVGRVISVVDNVDGEMVVYIGDVVIVFGTVVDDAKDLKRVVDEEVDLRDVVVMLTLGIEVVLRDEMTLGRLLLLIVALPDNDRAGRD